MYRYSRYIIKNLASACVLITFSLTSIVWLTQALRFIDFIVNRGVSLATFLHLALLLIPSLLMMVLPPALFIAVLFTYYKLIADSELVVMKSAGLSRWQLAKPAMTAAAAVTLLGYVISLWLLPLSYREFRDMQSFLRDNYASLMVQEEVFNNPVDGLTVFIRERQEDGTLRGILVHDNRQNNIPVTMMAESGKLVQTPQGPRFILEHGNRQEIREGKLSLLNFDHYVLDISFYTGAAAKIRPRDTEEYFLHELLAENLPPEEAPKLRAEAHQRITWPLHGLSLTLLGLAFLLSGEFNRRGQWQRIAASVAITAICVISALGLSNLIVKYPLATPLLYLEVLGTALFGLYVILNDRHETHATLLPLRAKGAS